MHQRPLYIQVGSLWSMVSLNPGGSPTTISDFSTRSASTYLETLASNEGGVGTVTFILDNSGIELAYDLLLAEALLGSGMCCQVRFHAKPYPTYVSDVALQDIGATVDALAGSGSPAVQRLAGSVQGHLSAGRLTIRADDFWVSPLASWEMPEPLRLELRQADLLISKGDANYRRWLGALRVGNEHTVR